MFAPLTPQKPIEVWSALVAAVVALVENTPAPEYDTYDVTVVERPVQGGER